MCALASKMVHLCACLRRSTKFSDSSQRSSRHYSRSRSRSPSRRCVVCSPPTELDRFGFTVNCVPGVHSSCVRGAHLVCTPVCEGGLGCMCVCVCVCWVRVGCWVCVPCVGHALPCVRGVTSKSGGTSIVLLECVGLGLEQRGTVTVGVDV